MKKISAEISHADIIIPSSLLDGVKNVVKNDHEMLVIFIAFLSSTKSISGQKFANIKKITY